MVGKARRPVQRTTPTEHPSLISSHRRSVSCGSNTAKHWSYRLCRGPCGLTVATAISLLIVPVLYAICALDLGIIQVKNKGPEQAGAAG